MEQKELIKLKEHALKFEDHDIIDKLYGKNKFESEVIEVIKKIKDYSSYEFVGELLINVSITKNLIADNFYGGFNEGEHYLCINSLEDVEKFKEMLFNNKSKEEKSINKDIPSFLKEQYQNDTKVIQEIENYLIKFSELTDKKAIYHLMTKALEYVASKKDLNDLFGVCINYYRNLEKDFKEETNDH